jgi:hypothetical protein
MPTMSSYCKAYALQDLRAYGKWVDTFEHASTAPENDIYLYVHDNFVVTEGIFVDEGIVFNDVTTEWKEYCQGILGFDVSRRHVGEAAEMDGLGDPAIEE